MPRQPPVSTKTTEPLLGIQNIENLEREDAKSLANQIVNAIGVLPTTLHVEPEERTTRSKPWKDVYISTRILSGTLPAINVLSTKESIVEFTKTPPLHIIINIKNLAKEITERRRKGDVDIKNILADSIVRTVSNRRSETEEASRDRPTETEATPVEQEGAWGGSAVGTATVQNRAVEELAVVGRRNRNV